MCDWKDEQKEQKQKNVMIDVACEMRKRREEGGVCEKSPGGQENSGAVFEGRPARRRQDVFDEKRKNGDVWNVERSATVERGGAW